jgi:hypothetical protein
VYSCTYINDTTNIFGSGSLTNQLLGWNGNQWAAASVGSAGTYLKSNGTGGLTYTNFINDVGNGSATECYSSQKIYADLQNKAPASHNHDSVYIKIADRKSAQSSTSTDVYDVGFLNTALGARLSSTVSDMGSSGQQLYQVTGNTLGLRRLAGGTNVTLSESGGVITITSSGSGGGGGGTTIANGSTSLPHVVWNGSAWAPGKVSLDDIVPTANVANGKVLKYDSTSSSVTWQDDSTASSVTLTSLLPSGGSNGQILKFDGTNMYWAADATSSGGSADGVVTAMQLLSTGELRLTTTLGGSTTVYTQTFSTDKLSWMVYNATSDLPTAGSANHGMIAHVHTEGAMYFSHNSAWHKIANATDVATNTSNIAAAQTTISGHTTSIAANANAITANTNSITANTNAITPLTAKTTDITYGSSTTSVANTLAPNKMHFQTSTLGIAQAAIGDIWQTLPVSNVKTMNYNCDMELHRGLFHAFPRSDFGTFGSSLQQQTHYTSNYNNAGNSVPFRTVYSKAGRNDCIMLQVNQSGNTDATDLFQYEIKSIDEGSLLKVGKQASGDSEVEVVGQAKVASIKFADNTVQNSALPAQTGSALHTHILRTNGTVAAWEPLKVQGETWSASSTRNANGDLTTIYGDQTIFADTGYDAYLHMVSPKNSNNVGRIDCYAHNSASATTVFSAIETNVHSNTSTATYGSLTFSTSQAGSNTEDLTAVMRVGKTSASDSAAQINGELRLTAPLKFNDSTTQASAVTTPATAGHVLTAGAGGSWAWAAAAGGSPTYTTTALPSYTSNATGPTNAGLDGVGTGDRRYKWSLYCDDQWTHLHTNYPEKQQPLSLLINGNRGDQTTKSMAEIAGSSWIYRNNENKRYPFSKVTFLASGGGFGYDYRFVVGGSNDGLEWTWFKAFSMGAGGFQTTFTCPMGTGSNANVTNYDGTSISANSGYYYSPGSTSGTTQNASSCALTAIWTNSTGYLMYRLMWVDGGGAQTITDNVEYYRMTIGELEWG